MKTIEKLRNYMNETGIDAVLVHSEINQRYFAKFKFSDGVLVILPKNAYLVTDFRYYEEAEKNASKDFSVVMPQKRSLFINEIFSSHGVKTVGFEKDIPYGDYLSLTNLYPDVTLVSLGDEIEKLRSVKSADELEKIASAQRIADRAFTHLLSVITPNMTDIDVALELEFYMRSHGAEGISFETIAVSGDASALPHGKCRNEKLKKGFLTLDFGAVYDGYCSDMTRTLSVGRATDKMKDMYYTTLTAQLAALDAIRAGADCAYLDSIARGIIDGAGYTLTVKDNKANGRAVNIGWDGATEYPNLNVTIKNLKVDGPESGGGTRGLNIVGANQSIKLYNCEISCNFYAINLPTSASNCSLNIVESKLKF